MAGQRDVVLMYPNFDAGRTPQTLGHTDVIEVTVGQYERPHVANRPMKVGKQLERFPTRWNPAVHHGQLMTVFDHVPVRRRVHRPVNPRHHIALKRTDNHAARSPCDNSPCSKRNAENAKHPTIRATVTTKNTASNIT